MYLKFLRNVTRQNCITKWEIDEEGNKVREITL